MRNTFMGEYIHEIQFAFRRGVPEEFRKWREGENIK